MNRVLLAVVALAVIALAGFAVFVIASGGSGPSPLVAAGTAPVGSPPASVAGAPPLASAPAIPATQAGDDVEATKSFAAWQQSMSAVGFAVKAGHVATAGNALGVTGLDVTGSGWHWTAGSAQINVAGKNSVDITATGDQTLAFTLNGNAVKYGASGQVKVGFHAGINGTILSFEFMNLSVAGDNDASPITVGNGGLRLVVMPDNDFAPAGTTGELRLNKLAMPALAGNPLGTKIDTLSATLLFQQPLPNADPSKALQPWLGHTDALLLPTGSLTWGALKLTGVGAVGLDDVGRPAGRFEVRVADVLAMLDGFHARGQFDRSELAKTYAKLLLDDGGTGNSLGLQFTIGVANGSVTLSGQSHGIDDLALGTVGQWYAPATPR